MNEHSKKLTDRRQSLRYPLGSPLTYRLDVDGQQRTGSLRGQNISAGGLGIILDHHLTPGTLLHLEIPPQRTVQILHSVRRPDGRWQAGGTFTEPLENDVQFRRFLPVKPTVLVVEEDVEVREVIELTFQAGGLGVWPVASGKEGLAVACKHAREFSLVLLDVGMSGLDGPQTLAALRQLAPGVPCWLMTGGAERYSDSDLLASGAARILLKPLNFNEIIEAIKRLGTS